MSSEHTYKLYKALKRFNDIAYDDNVLIKYKLKPGKNTVLTNKTSYILSKNYYVKDFVRKFLLTF